MKKILCFFTLFCVFSTQPFYIFAETLSKNINDTTEKKEIPALSAPYVDLAFSGTLTDENGEEYDYFLSIERIQNHQYAEATLMHHETKKLLLYETGVETLIPSNTLQWQIGAIFIQFNPINNSWIFGCNAKNKPGFNLRTDMLSGANMKKTYEIRQGLHLNIEETTPLNGHLALPPLNETRFATGKRAWFQQIWGDLPRRSEENRLTAIFCEFNEGHALYAMTLPTSDALEAAIAEFRDPKGESMPISQFIRVTGNTTREIDISSPKMHLVFNNLLHDNQTLSAGFIQGKVSGVCVIRKPQLKT